MDVRIASRLDRIAVGLMGDRCANEMKSLFAETLDILDEGGRGLSPKILDEFEIRGCEALFESEPAGRDSGAFLRATQRLKSELRAPGAAGYLRLAASR